MSKRVWRAVLRRSAAAGWHRNGKNPEMYVVGVDSTQTWGGMPSAYVESRTPNPGDAFGGMFDNMQNRAVKGTQDWQEASVVLDVPPGASALAYGFFVKGGGKMWVNGQKIEEVGPEVPSTNMIKKPILPAVPRNLGFDPNRPK